MAFLGQRKIMVMCRTAFHLYRHCDKQNHEANPATLHSKDILLPRFLESAVPPQGVLSSAS